MLMQFVIYVKVIIIVIQPELNSKTFIFAYFRWQFRRYARRFQSGCFTAIVTLHRAVVLCYFCTDNTHSSGKR